MAGPGLPRDVECGRLDAVDQPPGQHTHTHTTFWTILGGLRTPHTCPESMDHRWIQETLRFDLGAHRKPQAGESGSNVPHFQAGDAGGTV